MFLKIKKGKDVFVRAQNNQITESKTIYENIYIAIAY
jgi:hypothetical protein